MRLTKYHLLKFLGESIKTIAVIPIAAFCPGVSVPVTALTNTTTDILINELSENNEIDTDAIIKSGIHKGELRLLSQYSEDFIINAINDCLSISLEDESRSWLAPSYCHLNTIVDQLAQKQCQKGLYSDSEAIYIKNVLHYVLYKVLENLATTNPMKMQIETSQALGMMDERISRYDIAFSEMRRSVQQNTNQLHDLKYKASSAAVISEQTDIYRRKYRKTQGGEIESSCTAKVCDLYQVPEYSSNTMNTDEYSSPDGTIDDYFDRYINKNGNSILCVFGMPGIGKSTLISHVINSDYIDNTKAHVFPFSSFSQNRELWDDEDVLYKFMNLTGLDESKLNNGVLFLDGLDEIEADEEKALKIIRCMKKNFFDTGDQTLVNCKVIITCRSTIISKSDKIVTDWICLYPFNAKQLSNFCKTLWKNGVEEPTSPQQFLNRMYKNRGVFGIPFIAYIVTINCVPIITADSLTEVYYELFDVESGALYNRTYMMNGCLLNYEEKKQIDIYTKQIACHMFTTDPVKATISNIEYDKIVVNQKYVQANQLLNVLEGTINRVFIHRSLFEFFVAKYFADLLLSDEYSAQDVLNMVADVVMIQSVPYEIKNHFKILLIKGVGENKHARLQFANKWRAAFAERLDANLCPISTGSFFAQREYQAKLFSVWVELCHIISVLAKDQDGYDFSVGDKQKEFSTYVRLAWRQPLDLNSFNIPYIDLSGCMMCSYPVGSDPIGRIDEATDRHYSYSFSGPSFNKANLCEARLVNTTAIRAYCRNTNMSGAVLVNANFSWTLFEKSNLEKAHMEHSVMRSANFSNSSLINARFDYAILQGAKFINTNLQGVHFENAVLNDADFSGANLDGAYLLHVDLRTVRGISAKQIHKAHIDSSTILSHGMKKVYEQKYGPITHRS